MSPCHNIETTTGTRNTASLPWLPRRLRHRQNLIRLQIPQGLNHSAGPLDFRADRRVIFPESEMKATVAGGRIADACGDMVVLDQTGGSNQFDFGSNPIAIASSPLQVKS